MRSMQIVAGSVAGSLTLLILYTQLVPRAEASPLSEGTAENEIVNSFMRNVLSYLILIVSVDLLEPCSTHCYAVQYTSSWPTRKPPTNPIRCPVLSSSIM